MYARKRLPKAPHPKTKRRMTLSRFWHQNCILITLIAIPVCAAIIALLLGFSAYNVYNENHIQDFGRTKKYASYTVQNGDTLWSISEDMAAALPEYPSTKSYLRDLKNANNFSSDMIFEGEVIQIPYFEDSVYIRGNIAKYYNYTE